MAARLMVRNGIITSSLLLRNLAPARKSLSLPLLLLLLFPEITVIWKELVRAAGVQS